MTERTLPANPHPVPATISGYPILAYSRVPARQGELPNLAVMLGRDIARRDEVGYAVWNAAVRDGEWVMGEGQYDMSLAEAQEYYDQRCKDRRAV